MQQLRKIDLHLERLIEETNNEESIEKNWFDKNEDIHMLNPEQKKDVIKKILTYKL